MRHRIERGLKWGIAADVASGLDALHRLNIVHNDVKPANIVLSKHKDAPFGVVARLCDFGAAVIANSDEPQKCWPGHSYWAAPETYLGITRLSDSTDVSYRRDVYSYGLLIWYLAREMQPPPEDEMHELKRNGILLKTVLEDVDDACFSNVLKACLNQDPFSRCSMSDVLKNISQFQKNQGDTAHRNTTARFKHIEVFNEDPEKHALWFEIFFHQFNDWSADCLCYTANKVILRSLVTR
jgi:serine/threonine protein kinase